MRKSMIKFSSGMALAAMLVSGAVFASEEAPMPGNIANGKKIFTEGKGAAVACMTCHGETGWGTEAMGAPRLANLGYPYIVKQLTDLAEGRRTPSGAGAVMPLFAQQLTEQDRRDVAAYVNSFNTPPELSDLKSLKDSGTPVGQKYLGMVIVKYGVLGKVSACQSCHGYNGRGAPPMFPVIGQQKYTYLVNQLHNWRDASRANDPYGMMRAIAKNLTDDDIINVAAYLATAPRTTGETTDYTTRSPKTE
ncbi:MAG: c-type cytochrome [Betaproteobacteria bacterium]|nr:c-type cytochrome [Betaproteobacteria bacterium]